MPDCQIRIQGGAEGFACQPGESLLRGMIRQGKRCIPAGCLGGGCGICRIRVREGTWRETGPMSRAQVSTEEVSDGVVLACRTAPLSDLDIELLGRKPLAGKVGPFGRDEQGPALA